MTAQSSEGLSIRRSHEVAIRNDDTHLS